ncbi:dihydrofolate reductase [Pediococcus ethanolidurans]|uniref:dihydrofolate reductase family protein n=1 Tax=Pediococcus ethanolidurans TaxID=319653 RepID=UPI0029530126|nr:dihydrofolate reductase family protein [Pediococcus ethanolidurans]MDV7718691.1 dihydrofolate reductase [Pediococcus ethanolidurans]
MRQVQFYGAISLDGYLATPQHDLQWLFDTAGGDEANTNQFLKQVDTTIMGRKTYEVTKKTMGNELLFPDKMNYVLSRTHEGQTGDATYVNQSPVDLVRHLQTLSGSNIWIVGGGQVVTDLVAENLIDEWWIQVASVLLGKGIRLFPEGNYMTRLDLMEVVRYDQLAELHFKRKLG